MNPDRVIVVDDDEALLNLMGLALRKRGFQVELASDGVEALKKISSQAPFSVLLTDLRMPHMSGLELLREAKKVDPHLEVVIVTAAPDIESAIAGMRADGAYDYLLKPFESMSVLLLAVERAAEHHRLLQERETMQVRMEREAEMLRALIANTGDAILSSNASGLIQTINPAAARLIGAEDLAGKPALESLPPILSNLIRNWQSLSGSIPAIVETIWPDGSVQMISLTPIQHNAENHNGWVAVLRDITHIKRIEALKTEMLMEAAGKIRIPLAQAMNTLVELNMLTVQNERVSEVVYRLTQIWKRIQTWGDDFNTLVHLDAETNIQQVRLDLAQVLEELQKDQAELVFMTARIHLQVEIDPQLPRVVADPELLRRLLQGLLNRAASRSQPGGVVRLKASGSSEQVWICVSDEGPAVNEADLLHIFEKTFVKPGATGGTTGLEMAMVKTIIERMDGQVWVGGEGNKGGTIFVCLPTAQRIRTGSLISGSG